MTLEEEQASLRIWGLFQGSKDIVQENDKLGSCVGGSAWKIVSHFALWLRVVTSKGSPHKSGSPAEHSNWMSAIKVVVTLSLAL